MPLVTAALLRRGPPLLFLPFLVSLFALDVRRLVSMWLVRPVLCSLYSRSLCRLVPGSS